jgi:hypothetical protein
MRFAKLTSCWKELLIMNKIWADRLVAGTRTWDEVPASRKPAVKAILLKMVADGEITAEKYHEIVGDE